jgi:hypothetical protein
MSTLLGTCTSGSDLETRRRSISPKLSPYVRNVDLAREVCRDGVWALLVWTELMDLFGSKV